MLKKLFIANTINNKLNYVFNNGFYHIVFSLLFYKSSKPYVYYNDLVTANMFYSASRHA